MTAIAHDMTDLDRLKGLAHDRSGAGRLRLVSALADTYLRPEQPPLSAFDAAQLDALIDELFRGSVPRDVRQLLSRRAARSQSLPPKLAQKLIHDEIEVAGPVLATAALSDSDLLQVIGVKRTSYRMAIAGRAAVSEAVADALVTTGDPAVVEVLLKNFGARLSRASVTRCVELARQLQALRLPLVQRPELTASDAAQLLWWLPRELRQILSDRFGPLTPAGATANSNQNLNAANPSAAQPALAEMLQRWAQKPPEGALAERAALWIAAQPDSQAAVQNGTGAALLVKLLRLKLPDVFAAYLAQLTGLPTALVARSCAEKTGQTLAVLCRALGVPRAEFASLYMLAHAAYHSGRALAPAAFSDLLAAYDRIAPRAGAMLQAWRQNPELLKARV